MRIKLAPTNLAILEKLNQDYKIPVTSLANSCIYEKKLLIPVEIKVLNEIKYEINRIGRNLHQILKHLNFKEEFKSDDLKGYFAQLNMKLDESKKILENYLNYTNSRNK